MLYEEREDEALVLSGEFDISVPFSLSFQCGQNEPDVRVYPSLRGLAEEYLTLFSPDSLFSDEAIAWAKAKFGAFFIKNEFELSDDSDDYYINYRLRSVDERFIMDSTRIFKGDEEAQNLTDYDLEQLVNLGHMCSITVVEDKIVSAASTNAPLEQGLALGEIEIGVETASGFGGKGYGKSTVAALAMELARRGCTALYECAAGNKESVGLITSLGGVEYARNFYIVGIKY